jgi:hypothetical protein
LLRERGEVPGPLGCVIPGSPRVGLLMSCAVIPSYCVYIMHVPQHYSTVPVSVWLARCASYRGLCDVWQHNTGTLACRGGGGAVARVVCYNTKQPFQLPRLSPDIGAF